MADTIHPMAAHHTPVFITPPGDTDVLLVVMGIFLVLLIVGLGVLYFRLHALPEHIAHRGTNKAQFEIVAVLALLALFTHNNIFWVVALILAMIPIPDFATPIYTMAEALRRMARSEPDRPPAPLKPPQPNLVAAEVPTHGPDRPPALVEPPQPNLVEAEVPTRRPEVGV